MTVTQQKSQSGYRPAKPLPFELREHCTVYFEEELHSQALALLWNLLTAGADTAGHDLPLPVFLPPPQILALTASLIVYPPLTTRVPPTEKIHAADEASNYLNHVNKLVGAKHARLGEAFRFADSTLSRSTRRRERPADRDGLDDFGEENRVKIKLTGENALWNRADDFWAVVGWAFNCSVCHPARWERWKLWLELLLDVLEDDLAETVAFPGMTNASSTNCLLSQYLGSIGEGRTGKRRVMRSIFADGSKKSLAEFGEVWKNETKARKEPKVIDRKTAKLDFEKDEFADYMEVDEEEELGSSPQNIASHENPGSADSDQEDEPNPPGGPIPQTVLEYGQLDSILLRQRLLALLATYCTHFPHSFMDLEDLFDLYTEFIRPLPLPVFSHLVMPIKAFLSPTEQVLLNQTLLRPLIDSKAPTYNGRDLTETVLVKHYLPFAANSMHIVDNAKVSLLVESLFRLLRNFQPLEGSSSSARAALEGCKARNLKVGAGGRRKTDDKASLDNNARAVLAMSSQRIVELSQVA